MLLSPAAICYLDRPYAEALPPSPEEDLRQRLGMPACDLVTIEQSLRGPIAALDDHVVGEYAIAGFEAAIWCETVNDERDLSFLLLPRRAGLAERAWLWRVAYWDALCARLAAQAPSWERAGYSWFPAPSIDWPF